MMSARYGSRTFTPRLKRQAFPWSALRIRQEVKKLDTKNADEAITILSDEAPLKKAFNQQSDKTRLILLLSPT